MSFISSCYLDISPPPDPNMFESRKATICAPSHVLCQVRLWRAQCIIHAGTQYAILITFLPKLANQVEIVYAKKSGKSEQKNPVNLFQKLFSTKQLIREIYDCIVLFEAISTLCLRSLFNIASKYLKIDKTILLGHTVRPRT